MTKTRTGSPCPAHPQPPPRDFAVYYGQGRVRKLGTFQTVVLQAGHYSPAQVRRLRARGVRTLAYLSVGEDPTPAPTPWPRRRANATWNTWYVEVAHPAWRAHLLNQAGEYLRHHDGLLLDTLDGSFLFPEDRPGLLDAVRLLRETFPGAYLLANRGFDLLPELTSLVNGVLIESFSTTWEDGYRSLHPHELDYTSSLLTRLQGSGLDVYALDYARTAQQRRAARRRAEEFRIPTFISSRELCSL
ncbi:endo alpha-1,4 polygalactosaminidase [Deinococcus planocerae]|uniref:endo alpha-1,4 polygalactosaminidase n=1 Tax=Deinococcus planocerae TaxID=1737569 RepID=UPI0011AF9EBE|nr:endo alpha-1,4 polygalactosaminidase [Deinococcus planocerae]